MASSKVKLIPWDHTSQEHRDRMYLQRVACGYGWNIDLMQQVVEAGTKAMYWIVLADEIPDRDSKLQAHTTRYPEETAALHDTARTLWGASLTPSGDAFLPVGHIALNQHTIPPKERKPSIPEHGVVRMGPFYVSYALQSGGLGTASLREIERLAGCAPIDAVMLVIDAVPREWQESELVLEKIYYGQGLPKPLFSNEAWYKKLGYEEFARREEDHKWKSPDGKEEVPVPLVFVKKDLK